MAHAHSNQAPTNSYEHPRASGWLIGIGAVASVLLMLRHPTLHSHAIADVVAELPRTALVNGLVHGGLLIALAAVLVGFLGLADRLGWKRLPVRAAVVFHACGVVCMIGAALVNGFVSARIAETYAGLPENVLKTLEPTFVLLHAANQTLAQAGTVALSLAIASWSLALFPHGRGARILGVLGLFAGALPVAALLAGILQLDVHGMALVVLGQAAWNVGAAVWHGRR